MRHKDMLRDSVMSNQKSVLVRIRKKKQQKLIEKTTKNQQKTTKSNKNHQRTHRKPSYDLYDH